MSLDMQCNNVEMLTILNGYKPGWAAASRFGNSNICPGSTWLFSLGPFLEMFLSDSLFLGGGITGRGGSSGMSGSSLRLIPNTSKGSGDPKPNFIRIINFVCFQRFCSFSKRMCTFSCTRIPHTHAKKRMHSFSEYSRSFSWRMHCFTWRMRQFYVKLVLFVMFKKFLPKITILIKIVVYLCVVFQGWLLFPLCHV